MLPTGLLRGFVFPAAELLTRTRFWTYYKQALRFERWDDDRRQALRDERLAEVWNVATDTALHRQRLEDAKLHNGRVKPANAREHLTSLPPVIKAGFRKHFPSGVTTGNAADWRFQSTAGTTDRMTVIADFRKRDHARAAELRALHLTLRSPAGVRTVEIPPNACNVVCGLTDTGPRSLLGYLWHSVRRRQLFGREAMTELRGRFERQMVFRLDTLAPIDPASPAALAQTLDRYLADIIRLRPAHVRGFPVYLLWLADRCADTGTRFADLKAAGPYGGLTSPVMMQRIAAGLGCKYVQKYGTSELGVVAAACGRSPGMHVFEDLFHVEILRHGKHVGAGEVGRLAVTDLVNTAMPMIRYDVGDAGRIHAGPCPCGRKTARLEVLGRAQELLDSPRGPLTAAQVADTVFCDRAAVNFRVEEVAPGSFEAALVGRASAVTPDLDAWRTRFEEMHGGVKHLRAKCVPFLQPETSGKYRFVHPRAGAAEVL